MDPNYKFKLKNKADNWKKGGEWEFKPKGKGSRFYTIRKNSDQQAMGSTNEGLFVEEDFVDGKTEQLWVKGVVKEGHFTLTNVKYKTLLTAPAVGTQLKLRGNLHRCLYNSENLLGQYKTSIACLLQ